MCGHSGKKSALQRMARGSEELSLVICREDLVPLSKFKRQILDRGRVHLDNKVFYEVLGFKSLIMRMKKPQ